MVLGLRSIHQPRDQLLLCETVLSSDPDLSSVWEKLELNPSVIKSVGASSRQSKTDSGTGLTGFWASGPQTPAFCGRVVVASLSHHPRLRRSSGLWSPLDQDEKI